MALQLAVCVLDLDRAPREKRERLVAGRLDKSSLFQVKMDRQRRTLKVPEPAVVFSCDLVEAATVCDILRNLDRVEKLPPTRVYINRELNWLCLYAHEVLTVLIDGKPHLDPLIFPEVTLPIVDREAPSRFSFKR